MLVEGDGAAIAAEEGGKEYASLLLPRVEIGAVVVASSDEARRNRRVTDTSADERPNAPLVTYVAPA